MNFPCPLGNNILLLCVWKPKRDTQEGQTLVCRSDVLGYRLFGAHWVFLSNTSCLCVLQLVTMRMDWLKQRTAHLLVSRRSKRRKLQPHSSAWPPHIEGTGTGNSSSACYFLFPHQEKCMWRFSEEVTRAPSTGSGQRTKLLFPVSVFMLFLLHMFLNFTQSFFIKALFWG